MVEGVVLQPLEQGQIRKQLFQGIKNQLTVKNVTCRTRNTYTSHRHQH